MQKLLFFFWGGGIHEAILFFNLIQAKVYFGINIYIDYQVIDNLYLDLNIRKIQSPVRSKNQ